MNTDGYHCRNFAASLDQAAIISDYEKDETLDYLVSINRNKQKQFCDILRRVMRKMLESSQMKQSNK